MQALRHCALVVPFRLTSQAGRVGEFIRRAASRLPTLAALPAADDSIAPALAHQGQACAGPAFSGWSAQSDSISGGTSPTRPACRRSSGRQGFRCRRPTRC